MMASPADFQAKTAGLETSSQKKGPVPMNPLATATAAMVLVVSASNYLVQFPLNDWLTWGAFTYPVSFLVTDLVNRWYGPGLARRAVYAGFAVAVVCSIWLATPRIALASGTAFLVGQLLDILVFNRLRRSTWWRAPLFSSSLGSIVDTVLFFGLAFGGTELPVFTLMAGDMVLKLALAVLFLAPFRMVMNLIAPLPALRSAT
jgi:uncharacterized PurR-regulated membrane protein YhhQ (DUF165 family)